MFERLYKERGGRSELSGLPLYPPGHTLFHWQGSHLLPKGTYPDYRLDPRNVVMVHPLEHAQWEQVRDRDELLRREPRWRPIVERYEELLREAHQKDRPRVRVWNG